MIVVVVSYSTVHRPARVDRWYNGYVQLCVDGHCQGNGANFWVNLPRRRSRHESSEVSATDSIHRCLGQTCSQRHFHPRGKCSRGQILNFFVANLSSQNTKRSTFFDCWCYGLYQIYIMLHQASPKLVMEEAPESYKDVTEVVNTCHAAGISDK